MFRAAGLDALTRDHPAVRPLLHWPPIAAFAAGYLASDMVHFDLHHRRPRSRLGRCRHEVHTLHPVEDEQRGFGLSAPWWDVVFGTVGRPSARPVANGPEGVR